MRTTFQLTAPGAATMGFLTLRAAWNDGADVSEQRVRSVEPVKVNEVRFASGGNATDQFIELYNAGPEPVDLVDVFRRAEFCPGVAEEALIRLAE